MRIILYTGKGGVGKTSIAAATALRLAGEHQKVLIMSTDQAHSLSDSFEIPIRGTITKLTDSLDALEIDVVRESEEAWGHLHDYLKEILTAKASGGMEAEELLVFPGLDELFALFKILSIYEEHLYDVLIVDCAPTGETLNLLKFPEMFGNFINELLPMKRKTVRVAGPMIEKLSKIPMPKEDVFTDIEHLIRRLEQLQALMQNKEIVSLRIVTTPEKIVIKEAKRNYTCLHLYDYNVDAVIVNKIFPAAAMEGYFYTWTALQKEGLEEIHESFRDIPVFEQPLLSAELKSIPLLSSIGQDLYGEINVSAVLANNKIYELPPSSGKPTLLIHLPFASKDEMDLSERNGELHLTIKNEKRCFMLPKELQGLSIHEARFDEGVLQVVFDERSLYAPN